MTDHDRVEIQDHARDLEVAVADFRVLKTAYWSTCSAYADALLERERVIDALAAAVAERDRARDIAARLEAELARRSTNV